MNLQSLTLTQARDLLDNRRLTSRQLTDYYLQRLEKYDSYINSSLLIDYEGASRAADLADHRLAHGEGGGVLGIPYIIKDNILTKGLKTTAGSKMLANYVAPYDATVVSRLKQAGAVLLAKANLDEFALGSSTENSAFGPTHNPYNLSMVPGGSSGGSAAALAADFCTFSLGSDTGGSVRHPASLCGVVGHRPSYGAISRHGLVAMSSSLDAIGVLARSAVDVATVMAIIAGPDKYDATASLVLEAPAKVNPIINWSKIKIGWPAEYFSSGLNSEVAEHLINIKNILSDKGATIVPVNLPLTSYGVSAYAVINMAEVSSNLARFDGLRYGHWVGGSNLLETYLNNRKDGFGAEVKRRLMLGTYFLSAGEGESYYKQAQTVKTIIAREFKEVFTQVDYLLTPATPTVAFPLGVKVNDPLSLYLEDSLLTPASLAHLPAVAIPIGWNLAGLPIGGQLIGKRGEDYNMLMVAQAIQDVINITPQLLPWE
ncbi:MAG TPA: Asp-tRNA(Asn)/Glu-tRNA(Gln) amidotransferase subunit GatA [bacterium]|nr:Asp-tRNA(Asn)/Glu-tRNA(Gln) amidotransferase subunit GatA [bacterium]